MRMRRGTWVVCAIAVAMAGSANAQWTSNGPAAGTILNNTEFNAPCGGSPLVGARSHLFRPGGVFKKVSGSWTHVSGSPDVWTWGASPSVPTTIYVNDTIGKLYRTTNGGMGWDIVSEMNGCIVNDANYADLKVDPYTSTEI